MAQLHELPFSAAAPELTHLVGDLLFLIEYERRQTAQLRQRRKAEPLMYQAAAYLDRHACEIGLSLQQLTGALGISGSQLTKRFRAAYGQSPLDCVAEARLASARRLLVKTDHTLDVVAELCGYQNAFYFSRRFTRRMQISPSAYRRANRV